MKNRLVGILVLVLIAIIGWPLLFEDDVDVPVDVTPRVVELSPEVKAFDVETPKRDLFAEPDVRKAETSLREKGKLKALNADKTTPSYAQSKDLSEDTSASTESGLDSSQTPRSWTIQVASFVEIERARKLQKQLQAKSYRSYIRQATSNKGSYTRVYVGPSLNKQSLEDAKKVIDETFNLKSLVIRFKPE